jgi:non-ribosomal peptide synthase protein (TIGR01720 family)
VAGYNAQGDQARAEPDAYLEWLDELQSLADSPTTLQELPYWRSIDEARTPRLPVDHPHGSNKVRDASSLWQPCLDAQKTARFLELTSRSGAATLNATLLLALGRALGRVIGGERHCLDLGGHGRQEIGASADVSRTIGRFTNLYPFILQVDAEAEVGAQLARVRRDLDAVPRGGFGYGLLRYKTEAALRGAPLTRDPELTFSYMGQFDSDFSNELLTFSQLPTGHTVDLDLPRRYRLNVVALVAWQQLQLRIDYSREQYDEATIQKLAGFFATELSHVLGCLI